MSFHRSSRFAFTRRRLPAGFRWAVLGWLLAEAVAFVLLVQAIGLGGTILLGLATTVLGLALMRRVGLEAMRGLRRATETGAAASGALPDALLSALGAFLLIIPGFIANAAGLALTAPSMRGALIRRYGSAGPLPGRRGPLDVIDLEPGDWRPIDRA